jgi:hypothetical protein
MPITHKTKTSITITPEKLQVQNQEIWLSLSIIDGTPTMRFYVNSWGSDNLDELDNLLQSLGIFAVTKYFGVLIGDPYLIHHTITIDIAKTVEQLNPYLNENEYIGLLATFKSIAPEQAAKKIDEKQTITTVAVNAELIACTEELTKIESTINKIKSALQKPKIPIEQLADESIRFDKCSTMLKKLDDARGSASMPDRIEIFGKLRRFKLLKAEFTAIEHFIRLQWPDVYRINKPPNKGFPYFSPRKLEPPEEEKADYISYKPSYMAEKPPGSGRYVEVFFKNDLEVQAHYFARLSKYVTAPLDKAKKNLFSVSYDVFVRHYQMYPLLCPSEIESIQYRAKKDRVLHLIKDKVALANKEIDDVEDLCKIMENLTILKKEGVDIEYLMSRIRPVSEMSICPAEKKDPASQESKENPSAESSSHQQESAAKESIVSQMRAVGGSPIVSSLRKKSPFLLGSSKPSEAEENFYQYHNRNLNRN